MLNVQSVQRRSTLYTLTEFNCGREVDAEHTVAQLRLPHHLPALRIEHCDFLRVVATEHSAQTTLVLNFKD
jgi:hypothetical protein